MQYRPFGKLGWDISALGFGLMRLPVLNDDSAQIDEAEAARMVYAAVEQGVNYFDTAYTYHGGNSERFAGKVFAGGLRDRVRLATKLPCWLVKETADFDRLLNEQLQKLQTDRVDLYLLHGLGAQRWHDMQKLGVLEWAERAKADGRILGFGFSFHDDYDAFVEIVNAYEGWDFCQIQYNYMDIDHQAGTMGLKYAASKGLAVVVMEPLLGGRLVEPPAAVQAVWDSAPARREPVEWALDWLWHMPEVNVVLSGMSDMRQVQQNMALAAQAQMGMLSDDELALFARARHEYNQLCPIPCTGCEYCLPCSAGLRIPRLFELFNHGIMYNRLDDSRSQYACIKAGEKASDCQQCQTCESFCPQQIEISRWMERVHAVLGEGVEYTPVC